MSMTRDNDTLIRRWTLASGDTLQLRLEIDGAELRLSHGAANDAIYLSAEAWGTVAEAILAWEKR